MLVKNKIETIRTFEVPGVLTLSLFSNNIVQCEWVEDLYEIQIKHILLLKDGLKELGGGEKMRFYNNSKDFSKIDKEAMEYISKPEASEFTLANGVLVNNLAKKIMFNFFMKFNKPTVPTRAFRTKGEAFDWLLSV